MTRTFIKSILVAFIVYSGSAFATIMPFSQNSDVAPGIAAYNPTTVSAWPTPFNNSATNPPAARNQFTAGEVVSIAQMIDLNALNQTDDNAAWIDNNPNDFQWSAFWYDTLALPATPKNANFYSVSWSDISVLQASTAPVNEALSFWANDAFIPTAGNWIVDTYFEGNYSTSVTFNVPEPSTLFLLGLGLVGVVARKRSKVDAA